MSEIFLFDVFPTEIGPITVTVNLGGEVTELWTRDRGDELSIKPGYSKDASAVEFARFQVQEYAAGKRQRFDLALKPAGTAFQLEVWNQLLLIPYGQTRSYGELAAMLGNPKASRAVGRANGTNPISIIVPCHRVIGASGALTGYGGGLPMKQKLLQLEGVLGAGLFGQGGQC